MMDIGEALALRMEVVDKITDILRDFEQKTGLAVNDIDIDRNIFAYPNSSRIDHINLEVLLP